MSGVKIAALYGIWPFQLGLCGPKEKRAKTALLNYLQGKGTEEKAREVLMKFEAAFPYYCLIAKANNIKDPFDERVVKAYWIGNEHLEKVKIADLREMIAKDFSKPGLLPKKIAQKKAKEIPEKSVPHHNFHVLVLGSVTGKVPYQTRYLELCRIGWGRVIKKTKIPEGQAYGAGKNEKLAPYRNEISGAGSKIKIVVRRQPLINNNGLKLGKLVRKEINWDRVLVPDVKIGDWVSIHWNNIVQVLKKEDLQNLKKYTKNTLKELTKKGK